MFAATITCRACAVHCHASAFHADHAKMEASQSSSTCLGRAARRHCRHADINSFQRCSADIELHIRHKHICLRTATQNKPRTCSHTMAGSVVTYCQNGMGRAASQYDATCAGRARTPRQTAMSPPFSCCRYWRYRTFRRSAGHLFLRTEYCRAAAARRRHRSPARPHVTFAALMMRHHAQPAGNAEDGRRRMLGEAMVIRPPRRRHRPMA